MKDQIKMVHQRDRYSLKVFSSVATEYISNTTIHGLGYLGAKDKHFVEKLWWLIVFLFSLTACAYLISQTWLQWEESPVIVTISPSQTAVWDIPFPAVTICPINRVNQLAYNYTKALLNQTNIYLQKFYDVSLICDVSINETKGHKSTDSFIDSNIISVASKLEHTIIHALWRNTPWVSRVENLFAPILTEEGQCFTFNSLNVDDMYTKPIFKRRGVLPAQNRRNQGWNIENGYPNYATMNTYPERTSQAGVLAGLQLLLKFNVLEREYNCGPTLSGFKVFLHNPAETPRMSQQFVLLPLRKYIALSVKPKMVTTSTNLQDMSPSTKNCYFSHEKKLTFFSVYTQNNCRIECTAKVSKELCGCVPFYFPYETGTTRCGIMLAPCLNETKTIIFNYENGNVGGNEVSKKLKEILKKCNCLPSCTVLEYAAESSQTDLIVKESVDGIEWTQLNIFFKETHFEAIHRNELFGQVDFLSNCGGLLGLFMGFSVLSLIEIIYFLTIRMFYKYREDSFKSVDISSKLFTTEVKY